MAGVLFEDIFNVKDIDPEGKKFDRGRWDAIRRQLAAWWLLKGWDGRVVTGLPGGRRVKDEGAGWQSVLRPVDAATMPAAAAAAAAAATSTEQHRIRRCEGGFHIIDLPHHCLVTIFIDKVRVG
ncbi:DNA-directed RNA polymerases I, II, and III subunit RPABC3 [Melipona quadrifasciata]|uniref:DNA-directed RNA polymerases I, II, and III subunit RPABC3 n=1 Tax=Melipona quadrifasciata TaxID=166423 RepID=A0A0M9A4H9_9HYME|nr:DNA-directed RNA polymerases I, II, and III subunit RPABC3 [Melipona quadrifasciata]